MAKRRLRRFYVTVTWEDWPEGGSYGDVVEARDADHAEELIRQQMIDDRMEEWGEEDDNDHREFLKSCAEDWHPVDCFDLDEFIARHTK